MPENFHRSQILLKPEQHATLAHIASHNSRSISDVAREIVDLGFEYRRLKAEERLKALDNLEKLRERITKRKGEYKGNLVAEARNEKEKHIKRNSEFWTADNKLFKVADNEGLTWVRLLT